MKCPKCGYLRLPSERAFTPATECPACGIVYSKYESNAAEPEPSQIKKPSPVDEISLKTARERVEMRLRKRAAQWQTAQRNQTLQLAKQLAAEGVRKRREEWKRRQAAGAAASERLEGQVLDADPALAEGAAALIWPSHPQDSACAQCADGLTGIPGAGATVGDEPATALMELGEAQDLAAAAQERSAGAAPALSSIEETGLPTPPGDAGTAVPAYPRSTSDPRKRRALQRRPAGGRKRLWSTAAWLTLVVGALGAVLSWATLYFRSDTTPGAWPGVTPPVALLLGFAYLILGIFGFAFLWLEEVIDRRLGELRLLLLGQQAERLDRPAE